MPNPTRVDVNRLFGRLFGRLLGWVKGRIKDQFNTPARHWAKRLIKPVAFWLLAAPGLWLLWQWAALLGGLAHGLGFNPIETTHRFLGDTALRVLLVGLALSPLRDWTGWSLWIVIRRRVGLFAFGYVVLHLLAYVGFDQQFSIPALWDDVVARRYISVGMVAFVLLVPLAITSHNTMIRRLGPVVWRRVHWLVYPIAALGVLHHYWMVRGEQLAPWVHGGILAVLLAHRVVRWAGQRLSR